MAKLSYVQHLFRDIPPAPSLIPKGAGDRQGTDCPWWSEWLHCAVVWCVRLFPLRLRGDQVGRHLYSELLTCVNWACRRGARGVAFQLRLLRTVPSDCAVLSGVVCPLGHVGLLSEGPSGQNLHTHPLWSGG